MALTEEENKVVMAAAARDVKRAILRRRLRLAFQWLVVVICLFVLLSTIYQYYYQNNEIPFLRHTIYDYTSAYFAETLPNPGATIAVTWEPSPSGSSDLNTPITLKLALSGPGIAIITKSSIGLVFGQNTPLIRVATIHTSSWENHPYTAHFIMPFHLVPGYYNFEATTYVGGMISGYPGSYAVYLPCQQYIPMQGYPGQYSCSGH